MLGILEIEEKKKKKPGHLSQRNKILHSYKDIYTNARSGFIRNVQTLERSQLALSEQWMNSPVCMHWRFGTRTWDALQVNCSKLKSLTLLSPAGSPALSPECGSQLSHAGGWAAPTLRALVSSERHASYFGASEGQGWPHKALGFQCVWFL